MKFANYLSGSVKTVALVAAALAALTTSAVTIPNKPLVTQMIAKPMVMLVAGKDHKLFYEAYNDSGDIDGDGYVDYRFKPKIIYYGLFDSNLCYVDNGSGKGNDGLFTPNSAAGALGVCPGKWSGNWLNYITTSRIDSMRKVLYGGYREVDSATQTILRRAYIPQDAHSWAKEYTNSTVDGYKISDYTPLAEPNTETKTVDEKKVPKYRHFFGNLTANAGKSCSTLNDCSDLPPLMSVVTNSTKRVWQWASKERPVLDGTHGGTRADYTVRSEVCTSAFNDGCKLYGSAYKPTGLLHEYGENEAMLFGLLTGSFDQNMSGGVLRKVVSSFKDEVNAADGTFTSAATIVKTFDRLRIRDFNNTRTDNAYKGGWLTTAAMAQGKFPDWGNPLGEMMYESARYFAGKKAATGVFSTNSTKDAEVGLSRATWDDPYDKISSAAKAPWCAKANFMTISDINPSFDSDQVPGSSFNTFTEVLTGYSFSKDPAVPVTSTDLNVSSEADTITALEKGITGLHFIGQSGVTEGDSAPTAKTVASLGTIRGLAPEEPTKQGSYYAASVAYFAKRLDLRNDLKGKQSVDTFNVALASPLPRIEIKIGTQVVTLVPFAKSIGGESISNTKGNFQPTNQIVDFYVEKIVNSGKDDEDLSEEGNYGRYYAKFNINYEDVEQGADHDMDAIVQYEVKVDGDNKVQVILTPTYQAGGIQHTIGYVISGTTKDGVYLVVQDENVDRPYFLNVPPGKDADYCNVAVMPAECKKLPYTGGAAPLNKSDITFTPSAATTATLLKDPLWYASKWGGFNDLDEDNKPFKPEKENTRLEWDADKNDVPDTYFLVQNPLKLKDALSKAFRTASEKSSSASNVIANSTNTATDTRVFQARFDAKYWSGDLVTYKVDADAGVSTKVDWQASTTLPAPNLRKIVVHTPSGANHDFLGSSPWNADDKALLDADSAIANNIINYLRGDHTNEFQNNGTFRERSANVLGDIVHSSPFYVNETDTVFVGGNGGMLHAFKASQTKKVLPADPEPPADAGKEFFGFIPAEVFARLKNLTSTAYDHEFFVDGDIVVTPKVAETANKNLLFAALGRGGKGLFGLDVTTPTSFSASSFLWEYTPTASTIAAADDDLGQMLGRPIYAKMKDGSGAVIIGNGYNSTSGKAVLYIFRLKTDGTIDSIVKLDTLAASDNGLATPGVYYESDNGPVAFIYAGDLKGNVWKFDVSDPDSTNWKVDLPCNIACTPLFVAKDSADNLQPITAPMSVAIDNVVGDTHEGKRFVFFGTGSYFRSTDPADKATQTWYGLIDEAAAITGRSALKERPVLAAGTFDGKPVRAFSVPVAEDMVNKKGWYVDLANPPYPATPSGERIITKSNIYKLALPTLVASSIIPDSGDPCSAGGTGYINAISPFNGGAVATGILDINNNKNYADDLLSGYAIGSVDVGVGMPSEAIQVGRFLIVGGTDPVTPVGGTAVNLGSQFKGRISWREIIKD